MQEVVYDLSEEADARMKEFYQEAQRISHSNYVEECFGCKCITTVTHFRTQRLAFLKTFLHDNKQFPLSL